MSFTILTAVYNAGPYLRQCLDSVIAQGRQDVQHICIDDCSTDNSWQILQEYAARFSHIVVMQTPRNSGQAVARNLGLSQASGDFILMLDADDYLASDALSVMHRAASTLPDADALLVKLILTHPDGQQEVYPQVKNDEGWDGLTACRLALAHNIHGVYALRRELHCQWPYDTSLRTYSDDTTSYLHLLHSRRVVPTEAVYFYRQHAQSATHQTGATRLDFVRANTLLRKKLEEENVDKTTLGIAENYIWRTYVGVVREIWAQRGCFTPDEQKEMRQTLQTHYQQIRFSRLPFTTLRRPAYWPVWPFCLFLFWQKSLCRLSRQPSA